MKIVTIYKGDEHRAKIEKGFLKTDIFADVYTRANQLIGQITQEMEEYKKNTEKTHKKLDRYQGMGSNVILFCGERGQGKTSAMQSFAKWLHGTDKTEKHDKESETLEFVREADENTNGKYEVIASIDPSAMENGESIIGVLTSRLFILTEAYIKENANSLGGSQGFQQKKKEIVKLFEKCYANISYIKKGVETAFEQDDLEKLSQMGSSAMLKENLHELIEKYLDMSADKNEECKKTGRYLVIPIDDADLATKKVFKLCEDIRNYLSIPNVVILMAADYEQLVQATYQKYLKQYKVIREAGDEVGHKPYIVKECHEMAAKYLEKIFPIIHRIDLPKIDQLLMEHYEEVKFKYIVLEKGQDEDSYQIFKKTFEDEKCKNLQEQLQEVLYVRTGILFPALNQELHTFFPQTLRELTHWVRLLYDMHAIDCDMLYQEFQEKEPERGFKQRVAWLKENIRMVKQYFMSYWCEKKLNSSAIKVIQRIDDASRRHQMSEVGAELCSYFGNESFSSAKTVGDVMQEMVSQEFNDEKNFQEYNEKKNFQRALHIYYTIFLALQGYLWVKNTHNPSVYAD